MQQPREARFWMAWIPPKELRGNSRAHPMAKARLAKQVREDAYIVAREVLAGKHGGDPFASPVDVQYEFHLPGAKRSDPDNFIIGMKSWLDGVRDSGLIAGDSSKHITLAAPRFVSCKRGAEQTIVTITEIEERANA